jgi:hypothetical protein
MLPRETCDADQNRFSADDVVNLSFRWAGTTAWFMKWKSSVCAKHQLKMCVKSASTTICAASKPLYCLKIAINIDTL